jgi:hypothetical protein
MTCSVFFDTQIFTWVAAGKVTAQQWKDLLAAISNKYEYRVSMTTFLELLNAVGGGDEVHFKQNRQRLLVLTDVPRCKFLPLPGEFIRHAILGLPLERPEFSPTTVQKQWLPLIKAAATKVELTTGIPIQTLASGDEVVMGIDLKLVRRQMQDGQKAWVQELRLAKDGSKDMPRKELYAEFFLHFFARAPVTTENINRLGGALDAAYQHLAAIHHDATKSTYQFERKHQDWIDNQQLIYLADPDCTFVTGDGKLIAKLRRSTQRSQIRHFDEFTSSP